MMPWARIDRGSTRVGGKGGTAGSLSGLIPLAAKLLKGAYGGSETPAIGETFAESYPGEAAGKYDKYIGAGAGILSGLFGGGTKQTPTTRVDTRLPPTIVDMFSQMGYSPEGRAEMTSNLAPLIMQLIYKGMGQQGPDLSGVVPAGNIFELFGLNPYASMGPGIQAHPGTAGAGGARSEALRRLQRNKDDNDTGYYGY